MTLPHSLTSSQAQSEGQFLVKSPAPPLASAPAGILGSWPLPPPPGRCWYDCGCGRLLVGRAGENLQNGPLLFSEGQQWVAAFHRATKHYWWKRTAQSRDSLLEGHTHVLPVSTTGGKTCFQVSHESHWCQFHQGEIKDLSFTSKHWGDLADEFLSRFSTLRQLVRQLVLSFSIRTNLKVVSPLRKSARLLTY